MGRFLSRTPLRHYPALDALLSAEVYVKHENFQPTGSFKVRGQLNVISNLSEDQKRRGVIIASTGNDAQAVAYASGILGVHASVVMPKRSNPLKAESTRLLGADLLLYGENFDEAREKAEAIAAEKGYHYIHSANEPTLLAGAATVGLEIMEDLPNADAILVPVGGGACAGGICIAAKGINPEVRMIGVQSNRSKAMYFSWKQGRVASAADGTVHEGLATGVGYELTTRILRQHLDGFLLVSDEEITRAMRIYLEKTRTLVEGAGATPLAGAVKSRSSLRGRKVVLVATGANASIDALRAALAIGSVSTARGA